MPEHCSLSHHKVGFLSAQHQSFLDTHLEDLSQASEIAAEVISKDGEIIHENFETVAKKVREDCHHTYLEYHGGLHSSNGLRLKVGMPRGHVNVLFS